MAVVGVNRSFSGANIKIDNVPNIPVSNISYNSFELNTSSASLEEVDLEMPEVISEPSVTIGTQIKDFLFNLTEPFGNINLTILEQYIDTFTFLGDEFNFFKDCRDKRMDLYDKYTSGEIDLDTYVASYNEITNLENTKGLEIFNSFVNESKDNLKEYLGGVETVVCDVIQLPIAFGKGVLKFGESIFDGIVCLSADSVNLLVGYTDAGNEMVKSMYDFASINLVDDLYDNIYELRPYKYVNDHASKGFKNDGNIYNVSSTFGYIAPAVAISFINPYAGAVAVGISTKGSKGTQYYQRQVNEKGRENVSFSDMFFIGGISTTVGLASAGAALLTKFGGEKITSISNVGAAKLGFDSAGRALPGTVSGASSGAVFYGVNVLGEFLYNLAFDDSSSPLADAWKNAGGGEGLFIYTVIGGFAGMLASRFAPINNGNTSSIESEFNDTFSDIPAPPNAKGYSSGEIPVSENVSVSSGSNTTVQETAPVNENPVPEAIESETPADPSIGEQAAGRSIDKLGSQAQSQTNENNKERNGTDE